MPTASEVFYLMTAWEKLLSYVFTNGSYRVTDSREGAILTAQINWCDYTKRYSVISSPHPARVLETMRVGTQILKEHAEIEFNECEDEDPILF